MSTRPLVLAHRGASAYAPENTVAAFDLGIAMGAPAIETDVRATSDGYLVLLHDEQVDRTTNGHGGVSELTLAEVQALDAGSWFGPQFAGQRIPTAEELLGRNGRRVILRLEVKAPGTEEKLVSMVKAADLIAEVEFTSFSSESVAQLTPFGPEVKVGYLTGTINENTIRQAVADGARFISARADSLTSEAVREARLAGLGAGAWAVGNDELLAKVIGLRVDSFTTNWPDRALQLLASTR